MADFSLGEAVLGTAIDLSGLQSGMDQAEATTRSGFGTIGDLIGTAAMVGTATAAAAVATFGVASVNSFRDFQAGMNEVFSLMPDMTSQAMGAMSDQVKDFAVEMRVLPEDVVPALYESLSAGVPADNVFGFLETAQKAAKGGVTELATAVDGLTSVTNAYGTDVLSVGQASDIMFQTVKLGKTTFEELSGSLYNVIPTSAALGVEFGNVGAALAAMTAQGTPTSVATTQLRQLLVELSKAGTDTSDTFTKLAGQTFQQFIASGGNLQGALQLLEGSAQSSGKNISDLFGSVEAGNAALTLTGRGTETFSSFLEQMANSAGATDAAYNQLNQGLTASFASIQSVFSVFLLETGEKLAPFVQQAADGLGVILPGALEVAGRAIDFVLGLIPPLIAGWQAIAPAVSYAGDVLAGVWNIFAQLGQAAAGWGAGIVEQLAGGIMQAANAVVSALAGIGEIITYWLQPNSPPKITPNLDQWGTAAATVYMDGWAQADFSALDTLAGGIESVLNSIATAGGIEQVDVIPLIFGSRDAITEAINEFNELGSVSEATFGAIIAAAGPAGPVVAGLVEAYFEMAEASEAVADAQAEVDTASQQVAAAQEALAAATQAVTDAQTELNAVTDEYSAKLAPLNEDLEGLKAREQEIRDAQKLAKLRETAADESKDQSERDIALLEIAQMEKQQQIDAIEREREVALDASEQKVDAAEAEQDAAQSLVDTAKLGEQAAKDKLAAAQTELKAAQEQVATQKSLIAQTTKQNDLTGKQANLLEQLAKQQENTATKTKAHGGAAKGLASGLGAVSAQTKPMADSIAAITAPITSVVNGVSALTDKAVAMQDALLGTGETISTVFDAPLSMFSQALAGGGAGIAAFLQNILASIGDLAVQLVPAVASLAGAFVDWIAPMIPIALTQLGAYAASMFSWVLTEAIPGTISTLLAWGDAFVGWIAPRIPPMLEALGLLLNQLGTWITGTALPLLITTLSTWAESFVAWVGPQIPILVANLGMLLKNVGDWIIGTALPTILGGLISWATAFIAWVGPQIPILLTNLGQLLGALGGWLIGTALPAIVGQLAQWSLAFVQWVGPQIAPLLAELGTLLLNVTTWMFSTALPGIMEKLGEWMVALSSWVAGAIPPLLTELGKLLTSLGAWALNTALPSVIKSFFAVGESVVTGLQAGISASWESFKSWITGLFGQIPGIAGDAIGMGSPAVKMFPVGDSAITGFTVGAERAAPGLFSAVGGIATGVIDAMSMPNLLSMPNLTASMPSLPSVGLEGAGIGQAGRMASGISSIQQNSTTTSGDTYQLTANYNRTESERTLREDVRMLNLLAGG